MRTEFLLEKSRFFYFFKPATFSFTILGMVFIPFPLNLFPFQEKITGFLFGGLISVVKPLLFEPTGYVEISSDSTSLYTLVFILIAISFLVSVAILLLRKKYRIQATLIKFSNLLIPFYLSLHLLNYGFDKMAMGQFYAPETNILYTPFGYLEKDILFWSTMGLSPVFNIYLGLSQAIAGILLLFKKTRFFGFLIAAIILVNIVAINLGFDISVKIFSFFLLILALMGLGNYASIIQDSFVRIMSYSPTNNFLKSRTKFSYFFLKSMLILLILVEVFYQNFEALFYEDVKTKVVSLSGAYAILNLNVNNAPSETSEIRRVFIHRDGYFIFQDNHDRMSDYKLEINDVKNEMLLIDYDLEKTIVNYQYSPQDSMLLLDFDMNKNNYSLKAKMLDHKSLPVFNDNFHWTVDGVK